MSKEKVTKYTVELHLVEIEVDKDSEKEDVYMEFDVIEAEIEPLNFCEDYDEARELFNDYVKQLT